VNGFGAALEAARADQPSATGLDPIKIKEFYDLWIGTKKVVTVYSQGVNQSVQGTDKVNAIINCHLATGRIGKPGMGPFSVTGQPNAMGGREVGGLANMLACHLDLEEQAHRDCLQEVWGSPRVAARQGLKAVDLFNAVSSGQITALWIMSTNPAVSMPEAALVRDAIKSCPFTVVSDIMARTDTGDLADVLLPAAGWGEKSGTVTNSDRTISRQRAFLEPPGQARPDWKIICDVATRMGWAEAFGYETPHEIFAEYAALSGKAAQMGRDFDISGFADISAEGYEMLPPTRWPVSGKAGSARFFGDGRFYTQDGKARMVAVTHRSPAIAVSDDAPLRLNSGRIRDQWHTMTRTGRSARLGQHLAEPFVEIHPNNAQSLGIETATLVRLKNALGQAVLRALVTERTQKGSVFVPIHWTAQTASDGRIDDLFAARTDPVSGQPELKAGTVALTPFAPKWYGFAIKRGNFTPQCAYWAKAKTKTGMRAELAGSQMPDDWVAFAKALTICSCFNVGINTIRDAIARGNLTDVDAIGAALQAGTNCGSCRPELRSLLEVSTHRLAAE